MKKLISSPIFFVAVVSVFLISSYWIYKNIQLEDIIGRDNVEKINLIDESKSEADFQIIDNNIVQVVSPNEAKIVLKGDDIEDSHSISDLSVSPDGKNLCFLVRTIVPVWLYIYDLENENLIKVATAKNCFWSPDGNYIAYNNHTTDVSNTDVYLYNLYDSEIKNISGEITPVPTDLLRYCNNVSWVDEQNIEFSCDLRKQSKIDEYTSINFTYNISNKRISPK
ncbi:hypothetical protein K0B04_01620 [Patescibacteria group bacterium]|nr:hypothetical protein [Patescibacteria group bacterium]